MPVKIINGYTDKPLACQKLKEYFIGNSEISGFLYIGYPFIYPIGMSKINTIDGLLISPEKGLVAFNLVEEETVKPDYAAKQDEIHQVIEWNLRSNEKLVKNRQLVVDINIVTFAPNSEKELFAGEDYPLCNERTLETTLANISFGRPELYEEISIAVRTIGIPVRDKVVELALDHNQIRAVIEKAEGVQRIRGLSGSGKSTVLALKAAYVHACHPEWRIGVTYSTLSARSFYLNTIEHFYCSLTGLKPNWKNLIVCQAWGVKKGKNENAGMFEIACSSNFYYVDKYLKDKTQLGPSDNFKASCEMIVNNTYHENKVIFDLIIIDESHDFPESFIRLCYSMLRYPKRLVFAYDELQNFRLLPLMTPEDAFGSNDSSASVEPYSDIVLDGCYDRPPAMLSAAHALAFGIYREPQNGESNLVQMFENIQMWSDLGYKVLDGCLDYGKRVVMGRPSIDRIDQEIDSQIVFKSFKSKEEHDAWVVQEIKRNLTEGGLQAQDIMVVVPERFMIEAGTEVIRSKLSQEGIKSHLVGEGFARNEFWDGVFWKEESVPICSLLKARSNEAPMVYVVDAHTTFYSRHDTAMARNLLYSAMTRSTACVRVIGFGKEMDGLFREYERIKSKGFTFDFVYPTRQQQSYLRSVFKEAGEEPAFVEPWHLKMIAAGTVEQIRNNKIKWDDLERFYLLKDWIHLKEEKSEHRLDLVLDED